MLINWQNYRRAALRTWLKLTPLMNVTRRVGAICRAMQKAAIRDYLEQASTLHTVTPSVKEYLTALRS